MFHVPTADIPCDFSMLCRECYYTSLESDDIYGSKFDIVDLPLSHSTSDDLVPSTLLIGKHGAVVLSKPMKALFDTGSNISLINSSCLPVGIDFNVIANPRIGITAAGTFSSKPTISLQELILPEFTRSRRIPNWTFYVFDTPSPYDVILGRDVL